jgi:hypothetical protein
MSRDDSEWFAPKRFGYGAGLPISWQGWALTIGYMVGVALLAIVLAPKRPLIFFALLIPITVAFTTIAARTTRGGWRWRWGRDD